MPTNNPTNQRIEALRQAMRTHHIDAYIIPSGDAHLSEYTPERWKSRTWISGFTGSAGTALVTLDKAFMWTDSRYYLQATNELQGSEMTLQRGDEPDTPTIQQYLAGHLSEGAVVGVDGACYSMAEYAPLAQSLANHGIKLVSQYDLIEEVWSDRPGVPTNTFYLQDVKFSGERTRDRLQRIREAYQSYGAEAVAITMVDELCWSFNIRGNDVSYNPVGIAFGFIDNKQAYLFALPEKTVPELRQILNGEGVEVRDYDTFYDFLSKLPANLKVMVDPKRTTERVREELGNRPVITGDSVITHLKSIKNEAEIAGIHRAMHRDGVALTRFFIWLEQALKNGEHVDEYSAGETLQQFRAKQEFYVSDSFGVICGYEAHGAIVHYSATPESAYKLEPKGMLLLDSGGQYIDGTTDITRTIALGPVTDQQRTDFTLVLKGHIAIATARFPKGTRGNQLDILARKALWDRGLSYGHGTGHGVGVFLNVHEGPQNIRTDNNPTPMHLHTFTSNEPGLYRANQHGIRIENLILTVEKEQTEFGTFYGFETMTLCFLDNTLVEKSLLTDKEIAWYNGYQEHVYQELSPLLTPEEAQWLRNKTLPL